MSINVIKSQTSFLRQEYNCSRAAIRNKRKADILLKADLSVNSSLQVNQGQSRSMRTSSLQVKQGQSRSMSTLPTVNYA